MKIPVGMTESQVLTTIQKIAKRLAPKYTFGHYDREDIVQEAFLIALDGLERYDGSAPLEHFLSVHISNRLKTFKRDKYYRYKINCKYCNDKDVNCNYCYKRRQSMQTKKNIIDSIDIDEVQQDNESSMSINIDLSVILENQEIFNLIDKHLPIHLRSYYLKMLDGLYVPKQKRQVIENIITDIIINQRCANE